ncbi:MAG: hypothetical protein M0Q91_18190 [Methanoregula sp.]|jgi:hypothetical protein|nr:hypothetical protein [Methanoregula sp.]
MGITYGECSWKKFRITPDWKCVDFQINTQKYPTHQEQQEIIGGCRAVDWFDVCPHCRYFVRGDHTGTIPVLPGRNEA